MFSGESKNHVPNNKFEKIINAIRYIILIQKAVLISTRKRLRAKTESYITFKIFLQD